MYDHGQLIEIGDAKTVILGISALGSDADGSDFPFEFELETDDVDDGFAQ